MKTLLKLFMFLLIVSFFNSCGEENSVASVETTPEKVAINKKAITFPNLPTQNIDASSIKNIENN